MRAAIFLADGFEEIEALTVVDLLRRAEIGIDMVTIEERDDLMVRGAHGIEVRADKYLSALLPEEISMLILPGGAGYQRLSACESLRELIFLFDREEKGIAAICAAPSILGAMGLLKGKRAVSYPSFEADLTGALVEEAEAVRHGHIITGRGMGCSIAFSLAIVSYFKGDEEAERLSEKIVYRSFEKKAAGSQKE